jgi:hypothetical protein
MRRRTFLLLLPISLLLSILCLLLGVGLSYRLAPEHRRRKQLLWMAGWFFKGLFLPSLVWLLMNVGLSFDIQPFMPTIQNAQNKPGAGWLVVFFAVFMTGFFIISSYWAAITLGWTLIREMRGLQGDMRSDFKGLCWTCGLGLLLPVLGVLALGGWYAVGFAGFMLVAPVAGYTPKILSRRKMPPMYARAVAKMKFGKYGEAEIAIIEELEKREDDFDGWMMLAELYAGQFHDLREAEQTVLEICDQPKTTPSQIAVALNRLADWQLTVAHDPDAARRALLTICERLRNTHMARMAQLRMNQLPRTSAELREQQSASPIPLLALGDSLDEPLRVEDKMDRRKAAETANAFAATLEVDPDNVSVREKFARILAERLAKPEMGIEQLTLLLNMPEQGDFKRAEWLSLTAAWHIRYRQDPETGRAVLERVVREFPHTPQAISARRRIQLLEMEPRG